MKTAKVLLFDGAKRHYSDPARGATVEEAIAKADNLPRVKGLEWSGYAVVGGQPFRYSSYWAGNQFAYWAEPFGMEKF